MAHSATPLLYKLLLNSFEFVYLFCLLVLQKRAELSKLDKEVKTVTISPLMDGGDTVKTRKQLSQIIDTTLLKCYLEVLLIRAT